MPLVAVVGLMWLAPHDASAQFGAAVRITDPAAGAHVRGTIVVRAEVTGLGALSIRGVQFQLDGVNLGAEDTSRPYEIPWNTTASPAGPHSLRAVARDQFGGQHASDAVAVTVDNIQPTVSINQAAEQADPTSASPIRFTAIFSEAVGDFTAAGVAIGGTAGGAKTVSVTGGPTTFTVEVRGMSDGSVTASIAAGAARDTAGNSSVASTSTDNSVSFAAPPPTGTPQRVEDTSAAITYEGAWVQGNTDRSWSGGTAAVSGSAHSWATFGFSGSGVRWIGFRGPQAGIADVYLDGARVATLDLYAMNESVGAVVYEVTGLASQAHTLAIEVMGRKNFLSSDYYVVVDAFEVISSGGTSPPAAGDLFISLEPGPVQLWRPNGTLRRVLISREEGTGEGMGFDSTGHLYVTRWCVDPCNVTGDAIEKFTPAGESLGNWGSGYCAPHAIVFDSTDTAYVGQAGCTGKILKYVPGQPPIELNTASENRGSFWVDLAADGCTIFYTSWGPNVKRFDGCARIQLPDFNVAPLPGGVAQDLRVLPDGGVLVSSGEVVVRLDAAGVLVRTYSIPGENTLWAGLDLVGDGTFWVGNYFTSNVYRFNLATGAVVSGFNTGTPANTVVGLRVQK